MKESKYDMSYTVEGANNQLLITRFCGPQTLPKDERQRIEIHVMVKYGQRVSLELPAKEFIEMVQELLVELRKERE